MAKISGPALGAVSVGIILVWSGIRGWSVLGTMQDIISGKQPKGTTGQQHPITAAAGPAVLSGSNVNGATGNAIADDALHYSGHAYVYGGSPGKDGSAPWDCSSFCNWVLSHDLNLPWPGAGQYTGTSHGPTTIQWGAWFRAHSAGSTTVQRGQVQPGDVIVWSGHMGIAVSNTQMISARNPAMGTGVSDIDGGGSGPLICYGRMPGSG
jgi:cell wall-associated NlpC family hydrolase